jgi:hypothetical protein
LNWVWLITVNISPKLSDDLKTSESLETNYPTAINRMIGVLHSKTPDFVRLWNCLANTAGKYFTNPHYPLFDPANHKQPSYLDSFLISLKHLPLLNLAPYRLLLSRNENLKFRLVVSVAVSTFVTAAGNQSGQVFQQQHSHFAV